MVRTYIKKCNKAPYSKDVLHMALEDIRKNRKTVSTASQYFNIPKATLYDHLKGRRGMKSNNMGRPTALTTAIEKKLSELLRTMDKYGYGLSRKEVLTLVGDYLNINKIANPFKNGFPKEDWWLGFSSRNKLSLKKPEIVEYARKKACDPFIIYGYFVEYYSRIKFDR